MRYRKVIGEYLEALLNFVFPRNIYCIVCGNPINREEEFSLCRECKEELVFLKGRTCSVCGKPLDKLYLPDKCPECAQHDYYFTKAFSCIEYDEKAKKIIYGLKYSGKRYLSYHVAEIMVDHINHIGFDDFDIIIPIPLHKSKERARSFNQSYLIGKYLSKFIDKPLDKNSLIRVRDTKDQNKLTRDERLANLKKAFKISENNNIIDKNILLIDDVYTTGSTANEASRVLIEQGAKNVYIITFATGRNN